MELKAEYVYNNLLNGRFHKNVFFLEISWKNIFFVLFFADFWRLFVFYSRVKANQKTGQTAQCRERNSTSIDVCYFQKHCAKKVIFCSKVIAQISRDQGGTIFFWCVLNQDLRTWPVESGKVAGGKWQVKMTNHAQETNKI